MHVYPMNDEKEHITDGRPCHCAPSTEWVDPDSGEIYSEALVIHNALDCREIVEQAEDILRGSDE